VRFGSVRSPVCRLTTRGVISYPVMGMVTILAFGTRGNPPFSRRRVQFSQSIVFFSILALRVWDSLRSFYHLINTISRKIIGAAHRRGRPELLCLLWRVLLPCFRIWQGRAPAPSPCWPFVFAHPPHLGTGATDRTSATRDDGRGVGNAPPRPRRGYEFRRSARS